MSGCGKGGKGKEKEAARCHGNILRDNIYGIIKPAVRRGRGQGGVNCISGIFHGDIRRVPKVFLKNDIRDGVAYAHHARRKTLTAVDVLYALKGQGCTLYSFGGYRLDKKKESVLRLLIVTRGNILSNVMLPERAQATHHRIWPEPTSSPYLLHFPHSKARSQSKKDNNNNSHKKRKSCLDAVNKVKVEEKKAQSVMETLYETTSRESQSQESDRAGRCSLQFWAFLRKDPKSPYNFLGKRYP
ncbi:uncharacterized protein LOC111325042 [Stylophora pistillata]|uniref:uncharacterized protein LOC111325042 n=1 Tax=Stylophora pistillata TaxID=50429 RepID=UPI000C054492|nr:uncharacterized protein LOC111325042 [Stylophora pistillata]